MQELSESIQFVTYIGTNRVWLVGLVAFFHVLLVVVFTEPQRRETIMRPSNGVGTACDKAQKTGHNPLRKHPQSTEKEEKLSAAMTFSSLGRQAVSEMTDKVIASAPPPPPPFHFEWSQ